MVNRDKLMLLVATISVVLAVAALMWFEQFLFLAWTRRTLSRANFKQRFCSGRYFDLEGLLRVYGVSMRPHDVTCTRYYYEACLGKRIRLHMFASKDGYVLDKIQRFRDANWQFTDWYEEYTKKKDRGELKYLVAGISDGAEAQKKGQLPAFYLTEAAIEKLFDELKEGAN